MSNKVQTQFWREPWDASRRLSEMDLILEPLLDVIRIALSAGADATPFHASNASGTYRYQTGVWALRNFHVGDIWSVDRKNGIETIKNEKLKIKIAFSNVDIACDDEHDPKPRSKKGRGAEIACSGNLLPMDLPRYAPRTDEEWATYYLMVDENGASELSRPIVSGETFKAFVERIYLSDGSDFDERMPLDDDEPAQEFDPLVSRK